MRVFRGHSRPVPAPVVLAIGNFDGVHLGHAALVKRLAQVAMECQLVPTVLTFEPHPREFFAPDSAPARLTTLREKLELLGECGARQAVICPFNAAFAALSADEFVAQVLVRGCQVRHLIIGDDFRFGRGRSGDFAMLQEAGQRFGFAVEAMGSVLADGERVSSSAVRRALLAGDMEHAARLLGRPYIIDGQVSHGQKLGRQIGFATANLRIKHNPLPMTGVFAVEVSGLGDKPLPGVANLGVRPTVGGTRPLLEVHLFDFDRDIYGAHISVRFVHKLRDEQRFPNIDALKAQIAADAAAARAFFEL
ncbi:MAG: bifunctional riboflavin kinase/FAD synthetase [Gammaproteobacteria bacterium]|nr:bifunctional riboflavin kinase/FAD synthetase [Gammaproteobacteria bacterium]MBU1601525.1 bifunctional riboflavin kinase/FAD synthetase [Gammaproteobacteria bacterium]MBU2433720.1 bifunctional riboflavin kinase/FAD synthetase [Gammaproteobacteria bacterium]MBU2449742.1 bifunctional riboflavin kinase/FAD synthetase [Gammaproteobacteria bacterium]